MNWIAAKKQKAYINSSISIVVKLISIIFKLN